MGIKERQDRERQAVREAILDAARDLFVTEGYRHVSIRKIAERIEYSPAAIYSYFPGKDDIFFALAEEGFRRLDLLVRGRLVQDDASALDRLHHCCWSFYEFSREQPEFFELMFVDRSVPAISEKWQTFAVLGAMMEFVEAQVQAVIDAGDLPADLNACVAMHVLWAALMGPCVLGLGGRMAPGEDVSALARDVLDAALAGLQTGTHPTFIPCEPMHDSLPVAVKKAGDHHPDSDAFPGARPHEE
jgi:AcrR family transcriptional regulator